MRCRIVDMRNKDVVNIKNGARIGYVCDVEVDTCTAQLVSIIIYGRSKCFGLFGKEEDIVINWRDIEVIGEDTILVSADCQCSRCKRERLSGFGARLSGLFE